MSNFYTAVITEADCIGCTKCIQACPYDAIIGANKQIHTVLLQECTGCGLCVPPCPVDCITMITTADALYDTNRAKQRRIARRKRLQHHGVADQKMELTKETFAPLPQSQSIAKSSIADVLIRAKQKRKSL